MRCDHLLASFSVLTCLLVFFALATSIQSMYPKCLFSWMTHKVIRKHKMQISSSHWLMRTTPPDRPSALHIASNSTLNDRFSYAHVDSGTRVLLMMSKSPSRLPKNAAARFSLVH